MRGVFSRRGVTALTALLGYLLIAFVLTLPAWGDPTRNFAGGPGDPYKFMNFMGWVTHALGHRQNPLFASLLNYPRGVNLTWDTAMPLAAVLMWPVRAAFGVVAMYNVWLLIALTLDGWCTYLWLRRHTRHAAAAFVGGALLALGPYTYAHGTGHLNLVSFFPIPLMLILLERAVMAGAFRWRLAVAFGLLAAAQFYLAEELVALFAVGAVAALMIALLLHLRRSIDHIAGVASTIALSVVVFVVLAAPLLAFQFRGAGRVHGLLHPANVYVTDVSNLVIPTTWTLVQVPGLSGSQLASIEARWAEPTAYVGVFLIALSIYAAVRFWRHPLVPVVALATLVVELFSFGPTLHVASTVTTLAMPATLFQHLPVLGNLIPGRLSLIAMFGFAFLLAVCFDRTLFSNPARSVVGSLLSLAALVTVLPANTIPVTTTVTPQYFTSDSGARALPENTVALVLPYADEQPIDGTPMLWQAAADYHFALMDGLAITENTKGQIVFLRADNPVYAALHSIQASGAVPAETGAERQALMAELTADRVNLIIVGPMQERDLAIRFVTWFMGGPPQDVQGVSLWRV